MLTNFIIFFLTLQKNFCSIDLVRAIIPHGSYLQAQYPIQETYIPVHSIFFKEKYLIKLFPEEGWS